ncbi:MAG TPA: acetate--CoA ligase family protein [Candidatus Fimivivens sp.]|nr:acetate--CoA ligase family protein [Candidatus Fimivivens sp.]
MLHRPLDRLFSPRSIAVIGASTKLGSVGNDIAKNLIHGGFEGPVFPVNPNADELYGVRCYRDVASIGSVPDLAIIAVPAAVVPDVLRQVAAAGTEAVVIISAGFRETGPAGAALESELKTIARESGIALLGPNCLGFLNPKLHLNASFAPRLPRRGTVGFLSQSGALMTAVLDLSEGKIGFSKFVGTGNKTSLDEKELIDYLAEDPDTRVISFYAEGLSDAHELIDASRDILARPQEKPIVALKSGRTESGMRASGSHTGSLAGTDTAYDALFLQARILRANSIREFLDTVSVLSENPLPNGNNVLIITNAGGLGVIAADAATKAGLSVVRPGTQLSESLRPLLPPAASIGNPIDLLGDAKSDRYKTALEIAGRDPEADALIVIMTPQSMTEPEATARAIIEAKRTSGKPVLAVYAGGRSVERGASLLREAGVSLFTYPEDAADALGLMVKVSDWRGTRFSPKRSFNDIDRERAESAIASAKSDGRERLSGIETEDVLAAYGFPMLRSWFAATAEEAHAAARGIGRPVALKIVSPDIIHKTDAGGVSLDIRPEDVVREVTRLFERVHERKPDARILGVNVMEMGIPGGKELILGVKEESGLGTLILVGMGGIYTETLRDVSFRFAPIVPEDASEMLSELRGFPMLKGVRGESGIDLSIVTECIERLSRLVEDFPEIVELDINPLSCQSDGSLSRILDARISIRK